MLKSYKNYYLPFLSLSLFSATLRGEFININCYYKIENGNSSYILLTDENENPIQIETKGFDYQNKVYLVDGSNLEKATTLCKEKVQGNFRYFKGISTIAGSLESWHMSYITCDYHVTHYLSNSRESNDLREVLHSFNESRFNFTDDSIQKSKEITLLKEKQEQVCSLEDSLQDYIYPIFYTDFNRTDWLVRKIISKDQEEESLGKEVEIIYYAHDNQLEMEKDSAIKMIFNGLELGAIDHKVSKQIDHLKLRKHIALALATRSQTFEAEITINITQAIASKLMELNKEPINLRIDNKSVRNKHIVTVNDDSDMLKLDSRMVLEVGVEDYTVGYFDCERLIYFNVLTGEFSPETVTVQFWNAL